MPSNPLRDLLNKILWDPSIDPSEIIVYYVSRGAPGDKEEFYGTQILKVWSRGVDVNIRGKRKYIPFHRIIEVKNVKNGKILFKSPRFV